MPAKVTNVEKWFEENSQDFVPPVCNKCMYSDQLKMFFVGGPNQRRDYHLEEGEEVFYQLKGDMCLKVVERGVKRDLIIKEGEIFVLPGRVEHSPQRFENTIGAVVERTRNEEEIDCVRYFLDDTLNRQFERWFHLDDVVKDLPPLIKGFHASESFKSNTVTDESFATKAVYEPQEIDLDPPINLAQFVESHQEALKKGPVPLFGAPKYTSTTVLYGAGNYKLSSGHDEEIILWTITKTGKAKFDSDNTVFTLGNNEMARVQPLNDLSLTVREGVVLEIRMPGKRK